VEWRVVGTIYGKGFRLKFCEDNTPQHTGSPIYKYPSPANLSINSPSQSVADRYGDMQNILPGELYTYTLPTKTVNGVVIQHRVKSVKFMGDGGSGATGPGVRCMVFNFRDTSEPPMVVSDNPAACPTSPWY
jgi:hypothetical protein